MPALDATPLHADVLCLYRCFLWKKLSSRKTREQWPCSASGQAVDRGSITYVPTLLVIIHRIIATAVYLKWPLRLLTASEVTSDLHFEVSVLNSLCFSASLASILLEKPFVPKSFLLLLLLLRLPR